MSYPPHLEVLFSDIRAIVVRHLDSGHEPTPEIGAIAILGEHLAVCFALIEDEECREEAISSWVAELPRVVGEALERIARKRPGLQ